MNGQYGQNVPKLQFILREELGYMIEPDGALVHQVIYMNMILQNM